MDDRRMRAHIDAQLERLPQPLWKRRLTSLALATATVGVLSAADGGAADDAARAPDAGLSDGAAGDVGEIIAMYGVEIYGCQC